MKKNKPDTKQMKLTIVFLKKFMNLNRKQQLDVINELERKYKND